MGHSFVYTWNQERQGSVFGMNGLFFLALVALLVLSAVPVAEQKE
jgi:hypothetical protein